MADMSTVCLPPVLAQALQLRVVLLDRHVGWSLLTLPTFAVPSCIGQSLLTLPLHKEKRLPSGADCLNSREH